MDSGGPAQEVLEGTILAAGLETNSCDTLAKNVVSFCFCPKNLSQTKFKSNGPISWV